METNVIKTFILGLLTVCLLTLLGIYYVWQHHRLVQLGGELARASQTLKQVRTDNELLEAEYRTLRSAANVRDQALSKLRMKRPSSVDTIYMDDDERRLGAKESK
jgi:cell division protein FtsL